MNIHSFMLVCFHALNDFLASFGFAHGDKIPVGDFSIDGEHSRCIVGMHIVRFPAGFEKRLELHFSGNDPVVGMGLRHWISNY